MSVPMDAGAVTTQIRQQDSIISRGNGRSYGDAGLQRNIISTKQLNRIHFFDTKNGLIKCDAGILLNEILDRIIPHGYFFSVTPGTKSVSVGGAIAADVHGKNHPKAGTFSRDLINFNIVGVDGVQIQCSREEHEDLFWATCGGMGLTGIILDATIQLMRIETSYILESTYTAKNLSETIDLFTKYEDGTYKVAWIDTLSSGKRRGRSIFRVAEHATSEQLPPTKSAILPIHNSRQLNVPFFLPNLALNHCGMLLFNQFYYQRHCKKISPKIISYESFFYPLDKISNWNRIYGKRGFMQYQFVVPSDSIIEVTQQLFQIMHHFKQYALLSVLKRLGPSNDLSPLSFPMAGYTLSLDFKVKNKTSAMFDEFDLIIQKHGGKVYLAKDGRLSQAAFEVMYAKQFVTLHRSLSNYNKSSKFRSLQSDRIGLTRQDG